MNAAEAIREAAKRLDSAGELGPVASVTVATYAASRFQLLGPQRAITEPTPQVGCSAQKPMSKLGCNLVIDHAGPHMHFGENGTTFGCFSDAQRQVSDG